MLNLMLVPQMVLIFPKWEAYFLSIDGEATLAKLGKSMKYRK